MGSRSDIFRAKVDADPGNLLFLFSLGQALVEEEEEAQAIAPLKKCVGGNPDWMAPKILLGKCLLVTSHEQAAVEVLEQALDLAIGQGHEDPEMEIRGMLSEIQV